MSVFHRQTMSFLHRLPFLAFRSASTSAQPPSTIATKVQLSEVKNSVVQTLESTGPISRRILYDHHLTRLYPAEPFTPNAPPIAHWLRDTTPTPPVYLTMSKFKRQVLASLERERSVSIVTVSKIKRALDLLKDLEDPVKKKIEESIANLDDKTHLCVAGKWWKEFQKQSAHSLAVRIVQQQKLKKPLSKSMKPPYVPPYKLKWTKKPGEKEATSTRVYNY